MLHRCSHTLPWSIAKFGQPSDLPDVLREDLLILLPVDPERIFATWNISYQTQNSLAKILGEAAFATSRLASHLVNLGADDDCLIFDISGPNRSRYLSLNRYHAITSPDFDRRLAEEAPELITQEGRKRFAIRDFIDHLVHILDSTGMAALRLPISIGFSDDDPRNVKAVQEYIERVLSRRFPTVKFCVYDTSDGAGVHKMMISGQLELPLE